MPTNNKQLAELLFPDFDKSKDRKYWENHYPKRDNNNPVLRLAPSPTGFLHLGTLYVSLLNKIISDKDNGKLILRIEDTDTKREQDGSIEAIVRGLSNYNINADEGFLLINNEIKQQGDYGPYLQSERADIYTAFIYDLIERDHAYPCFMTSEELETMREEQRVMKIRPGCYGPYAKSRELSIEEIESKINKGEKWVIRLKSSGDFDKKIDFVDEFMGKLSLSQNDEDFVLYKDDGLPTYHLAHLIDDYLMGVNYVVRANEWVSSITKHIELWDKLRENNPNINIPKYGHIMPINTKEGESVRKLSKRKDKEANIEYFIEKGYPNEAIIAYLIRLMCPTFDEFWNSPKGKDQYGLLRWNINNNLLPKEFIFNEDELKRNSRGPLFDQNKLDSLSEDVIASMHPQEIWENALSWAEKYDGDFYNLVTDNNKEYNKQYLCAILNIERDDSNIENVIRKNIRKDIKHYSEVQENVFYFYDELFQKDLQNIENNKISNLDKNKIKRIYEEIKIDTKIFPNEEYTKWCMTSFKGKEPKNEMYSLEDWVLKMKSIFENLKNEGLYNKFGEMMADIRVSITNRDKTPNLYYIFEVMGKERILKRIETIIK